MEGDKEPVSYGAIENPDEQPDNVAADGDGAEAVEQVDAGEETEITEQQEESFVTIQVDTKDIKQPTLAPIGSRLKRNAQIAYNPFDWSQTTWVLKGRPHVTIAYYVVAALGTVLVFISSLHRFNDGQRACRAWCTVFSLSTQPHQYIGFILFLLMSFRTSNSYRNYVSGQTAFYQIRTQIRVFTNALLCMTTRDSIPRNRRARMLAYAVCFPFALTSELRMERHLDKKALKDTVSDVDLDKITAAPSMTQYILESLNVMVSAYVPKEDTMARKVLHGAVMALYRPYSETERIQFNPMGFSYVVHLRLLLLMYLTTLPLAFVEKLGFATILVHWVITYALMSLEMLAVQVENPFGHEVSDLRLYQYNMLIRDSVLESWEEWEADLHQTQQDDELIEGYSNFGNVEHDSSPQSSKWFFF